MTALDDHMKQNRLSDADLASLIDRDRSIVSKIRRGVMLPTLEVAAAIERATGGHVPMQAWIADGLDDHADASTPASAAASAGYVAGASPCSETERPEDAPCARCGRGGCEIEACVAVDCLSQGRVVA